MPIAPMFDEPCRMSRCMSPDVVPGHRFDQPLFTCHDIAPPGGRRRDVNRCVLARGQRREATVGPGGRFPVNFAAPRMVVLSGFLTSVSFDCSANQPGVCPILRE